MKYICPMHPKEISDKPGKCGRCGMDLVKESDVGKSSHSAHATHSLSEYKPLLIIVSLIVLVSYLASYQSVRVFEDMMRYFMAGFFVVFSGFKLIDLKGFASGYSTYDLLARKVYSYGYVYPFLELGLGVLYITNAAPTFTNIVTIILMTFSGMGVVETLKKKREFTCACLGTAIKLPLTSVTLIEDFGMALMALLILLF